MPLQLEIIRATEFVRVGAQGQFDLAASKIALVKVAGMCRQRGIHHAVLDLRALQPGPKPVFTRADLEELVSTFPEAGFTKRLRLAILYRSDPHRRARLFAFLSHLHGWNVQAFGGFEDALMWLSRGSEAATEMTRASAAQTIPIRFACPDAPLDPCAPPVRPRKRVSSAQAAGPGRQPGPGSPTGAS
jgi:hypothetical protein